MALLPGTRLGPYEVLGPLGAGGMGEVYRAKDTTLGRDVAVKVLPEHLAHDPERLARFEREAKTLALLNHPHIAQIHGFEHAVPSTTAGQPGSGSPVRALVMELVEGPTLADRIADGPIPLDEAWPIARQIAEALEAAHDQGIVHRDLKPANIKVRSDGTVKVLDFGLAKATTSDSGVLASDSLANSPTIASPAHLHQGYGAAGTEAGMILGTAAYMSPEQAKGKPVDRRADIWAFGCVLFEMLTGRWVFDPSTGSGSPRAASRGEGQDVSETLASVLRAEPAWSALPAATPARVRTLLKRCIERDLQKRLPHIGVARLELAEGGAADALAEAAMPAPPLSLPARGGWKTHAAWAAAALALAAAAGIAVRSTSSPTAAPAVYRFDVRPPEGQVFPGANGVPRFAVSPDGTQIVFTSSLPGQRDQLFVRRLGAVEAEPIKGTESPASGGDALQQPFFSPDGRFVAFFSGQESALKRVPVGGGPVERLASLPVQNCSGSWHGDVMLVASAGTNGVQRLPASGGTPTPVTTLDASRKELVHLFPQFLPDGEHFLYFPRTADGDAAIYVGSLSGGAPVRVVQSEAMARFAPPNQLLYVRGRAVVSQTLELSRFALVGDATTVSESVMVAGNARLGLSTSDNGVVVLAQGRSAGGLYQILARDRAGRPIESGVLQSPIWYPWARLSPDGRSVAFSRTSDSLGDVWVKNLDRGVVSRVTTDGAADSGPVWSNDGRRVVYTSNRGPGGRAALFERDVAALSAERLLLSGVPGQVLFADDWSPDGHTLVYRSLTSTGGVDLMVIEASEGAVPKPYLRDGFFNRDATFSPDGRWLAYSSNDSGTTQVFVRSFPDPTQAKYQVSADGGAYPRWRRDGGELYFLDARRRVVAVRVTHGSGLSFDTPTPLFDVSTELVASEAVAGGSPFDVSADGQRFIIVAPRGGTSTVSLTVAVNWMADLKPTRP